MAAPHKAPSIYLLLISIILPTVFLTVASSAAFDYFSARQRITQDMHAGIAQSLETIRQNITGQMEAYAASEYERVVANEVELYANCGVRVEDYNLGRVLGQPSYTSGFLRLPDGQVLELNPNDPQHWQHLEQCYYRDSTAIFGRNGEEIGRITLYASSAAIDAKMTAIIRDSLINTLVICTLMVLALLLMTRRFILAPLERIINTIRHTDKTGIPVNTVPDQGPREVRTLAHSINTMITSIRASRLDLQEQKDALDYMAHHDALTGLANRTLFNDRLGHAIAHAVRHHQKVAVLFLDLDHFKTINDSLGHTAGDKVLNIITERLRGILRAEDTLARQGGDEFTILLEGQNSVEQVSAAARKILHTISQPLRVERTEVYISGSIGISLFPDHGNTVNDLLMQADAAMYQAKSEGRSDYCYFSHDLTEQALERLSLETQLRTGLEQGELTPYFQAQVDAATGQLLGFEALARWHHPTQGMISPARFIPLAESTGLIHQLDLCIIRQAMTRFAQWYRQGLNPGILSVNLTMRHFQHQAFLDTLQQLLAETGCQASWLQVEVTESQLMAKPEATIEVLRQIHDAGIRIALDDFGTGYSSLSYLKRLPITKLKIDQSFIRDLPHDEEDISITRAIIALANSLNLEIIAEGAETAEQVAFLLSEGCHQIQGYYYARPLPADGAEVLMSDSSHTTRQADQLQPS
ncbi:putative bifunctional diguanylate cyclase/phosphodiesterase [Marinobacterium weihaiense]|uniref:EAL domain-containing protein n=1 Tax=Marinobacterium weihaiense TaxID=2851016 RepID=A0ABS6MDP5_9GAMM|nr:EAL domain-containing protein [Marinobacterium weihaiense]MBV0934415.1 EAL domain-containing protein [Marinobacterium weihaiense]